MSLRALANCTYSDMESLVKDLGQPVFRAKQIMEWVFKHYELDPERMLNLPLKLRKDLKTKLICMSSEIKELSKGDDKTTKLLISLSDKEAVEMVIIPSRERLTFCLSTQVGCPVGCRFCASGEGGLVRNLEAHEIIEQLYHGIAHSGSFPDNIVFMGIGEGLLNFDKLAAALGKITEADYIGMSPRRITISTSGYVPGIYRLIELGKPFILAVSLHAVDDATRAEIIPGKLCYPIAEILQACDDYEKEIGRMVTFEYTMLAGINDSNADAEKLAKMARRHHAKINLIPYNETSKEFKRPKEIDIFNFRDILEKVGVTVMLRLEKGGKVNAACGQLRVQHIKDQK
ncbi:MAG: 23S rRNA (adenine(2503)-C(2))-methyltransferase RlmN [Victivallales bacterium]|nr:23S rRNA (adenine(2503)-C(2))-methyltransferase RlmN [Victivallales bacterium]